MDNNIKELIQKFCPDGVKYKKLADIAEIGTGSQDRKNAVEDGKYPFYVRSKDILRIDKYLFDEEAIIIPGEGGIGDIFHYVKGKYGLHQRAYRVHIKDTNILTKYVYYYFWSAFKSFIFNKAVSATVTSIRKPMLEKFEIPIPPIEVQRKMVQILDIFTELEAELEAELDARKQQYLWAEQTLLKFEHCPIMKMGDVCTIEKGKTPIQKAIPGEYPLVVTTDERRTNDTYQFDNKAVCLSLVSARGHGIAQVSRVFYQEGKFALGNILCAIIPKDEEQLSAKFLRYYLYYTKDLLLVPLMKGGANVSLHINDLEKVKIPIPPISEQNRIVSILEKIETLINSKSIGLPAEIAARHQQYEYYRDQLLTFKRKA